MIKSSGPRPSVHVVVEWLSSVVAAGCAVISQEVTVHPCSREEGG